MEKPPVQRVMLGSKMKWLIGLVWVAAIVLQSLVFWALAHYLRKANPKSRDEEYRYLDDDSLRSYSQLALEVGGFGAATLWAVLPVVFDTRSPFETPLTLKLVTTFLIVGILSAGIFITVYHRIYELAGRPKEKEFKEHKLNDSELRALLVLGFMAITGVLQGAYFLLLGIWKVRIW